LLAAPLLAAPLLAAPLLAAPLPAAPLPVAPLPVAPLLVAPLPPVPVLVDGESAGLVLAPPVAGELDAGVAGVEEPLPGVDEDAGAFG
jgi:hypothetical protein